jgi:hypothetical protein
MAVLLKSLFYLGYFPDSLRAIPSEVREFIAKQLGALWDPSEHYPADERTRRYHIALIRKHIGVAARNTNSMGPQSKPLSGPQ